MKDPEVLRDEFIEDLRDSYVSGFADGYKQGLMEATRWIPVTERLPEEKVEVLVTVEVNGKNYIENGMLSGVNHDVGEQYTIYEFDVYGRHRNSKVIAWMPLPEPYKESEK